MDFLTLAGSRYSVRKFDSRPIEQDKIDQILQAARIAPTACNRQPQRIYVLKSRDALEKLKKCKRSWFGETLAFLICCDTSACWVREYDNHPSGEIDASIVSTQMMLEAWDLGIGSTWVMHFVPQAVREAYSLPDNIEPVCLLVMGYPASDATPHIYHGDKKDISETVRYL